MSNATAKLGEEVEIRVRGRILAVTESINRPTRILVEYGGRNLRRDWFAEGAIVEGDDDE